MGYPAVSSNMATILNGVINQLYSIRGSYGIGIPTIATQFIPVINQIVI